MKDKRIIVIGANGMLGNYIYTYFLQKGIDVVGCTRKNFDIVFSTFSEIQYKILEKVDMRKENTIINCVGEIPQRKNIKSSDMILINSVFPHWLQEICGSSSNCKLINITTDCVFSGKKGNYVETDVHDSLYLYGKSKSMGEPPEAMNIRTSIIGEEIYNKLSLLEWVKSMSNTSIEGFINHIWNGVTCLELTKHIESLLRDDIYIKGVRHLFTEEKCNKFQLVNTINDIWKLNIEIVPVNTELIDRSLNTIYKNNITKNIKQQLEELKDFDLYYKVGEISS